MRRQLILVTLLLTWAVSRCLAGGEAGILRIRADLWMPYNGEPAADQPGYAVELARAIFEPRGIKVDYRTLPWTEALASAREGTIDAVIGASHEEAEGLLLPNEPIGGPQAALMTRKESAWRYDNIRSFRDVKLGVIAGYSYWPGLDKYIAVPANQPQLAIAESETPLTELLNRLDAGQIDVLVEFEAVLLWELRARGLKPSDYRVVYKHEPDQIFVAFSNNERGRKMAALFDEGLVELRANGRLSPLLRRYGLRDWK